MCIRDRLISFIPMSLGYIFLFAPRQDWDMSQNDLFLWMTIFTVLTRLGMTLFDIPHRAFGGEITKNYEERTLLMSWREMIGWVAGLSNAFLGYGIFFASTPEYPQGQLNPDAWFPFAVTGAVFMIMSVLYSSISTKNEVKSLSKWSGSISLGDILKELKLAIGNKSFLIFFFGNLFLSLSWGLANTLTLFVNTYFWEFEATQIKYFLPIFKKFPNADIELRTKSTQMDPLFSMEPISNCVVAFSLMPTEIAKKVDHKAPSIEKRINTISELASMGWKIGLRFDPLIHGENWKILYSNLFENVFKNIDRKVIHSITLGPLRFPKDLSLIHI